MKRVNLQKICQISLFSALMAVTAMISIPFPIPFTLQTFSIFLAFMFLGGKSSLYCITTYIALGIFGLPVFAGFNAGLGYIFGASGGFIIGFFLSAVLYLILESCFGVGRKRKIAYSFFSLLLIYLTGALWFAFVYSDSTAFLVSLATSVLPFIFPDTVKLMLAFFVSEKLNNISTIKAKNT